jgi:hypothetical protein
MEVVLVAGTIGFLVVMPFGLLAWTWRRAAEEREASEGQAGEAS